MVNPREIRGMPRQMEHHLILVFGPLSRAREMDMPLIQGQLPELIGRETDRRRVYEALTPVSSPASKGLSSFFSSPKTNEKASVIFWNPTSSIRSPT